jgi:hypothetical protein
MADSAIYVRATGVAGVDAAVDTEQLTVGAKVVERQRIEVTGASAAEIARVIQSAPAGTEFALVVRPIPSGTQDVNIVGGGVTISPGDIEIGAVEVKNATTDDRLSISAAGAAKVDGSAVTQPMSAAALPLPTGAATEATAVAASAKLPASLGQKAMAASLPVVIASDQGTVPVLLTSDASGLLATENTLAARLTQSDFDTKAGSLTETAPATDTASSGLNGRLQRIAQRITSLIASTLGFSVNAGNADATTLRVTTAADGTLNTNLGALADAVITTDTTGSLSGKIRGLVKWAFERMPAALGQGTKAQGLRVTLPSDQDPVPVYGARARGNKSRNTITLSGTAAETTLLAAVASTYLDLVAVIAINTSATAVRVDFRDDTGGSVVFALQIPAGETRDFVVVDEPIEQVASNKNWTAQCAATVADVRIFAMAVKKT